MGQRERWGEVKPLLERALEVPHGDRAQFLAECGAEAGLVAEVEGLLALEIDAGGFIDEPLFSLRAGPAELGPGDRLGPWRILGLLGQGGMGTVYRAERADGAFDLTVALKVLQAGLGTADLVARFEAERHILARLVHPNIARLLDGGTSEGGRPYLVMELVTGEPIDEYCTRHRLPPQARLELFRDVCAAVQLAHQNLVVHRDLKPANILVTAEGTVKLLDFGIAKLLAAGDGAGAAGHTVGPWAGAPLTPRYASPEQVRGEPITTAADVYSLGVILFELLTGQRPYRIETSSPAEIERVICESAPPRPSTAVRRAEEAALDLDAGRLARRLAGDLDTIVLRALAKEPTRRFSSAEQLAEDLRLYLAGLPIRSRPDSPSYRAGKFLARHRLAVGLAAGALAVLVGFAAMMTWQRAEIAAREREVARERDRAETTTDFLVDLISDVDPRRAKGREPTLREAVDQGAERLARETALDPLTRAALLGALGVAHRSNGQLREAEPLLHEALALRRRLLGEEHELVAESLVNLANLERAQGHTALAEEHLRTALQIFRGAHPRGHLDLATALNNLASLLAARGELAEAETLAREGLAMKERLGADAGEIALSLNTLAAVLAQANQPAEAETLYRRCLTLRRQHDGPLSVGLAKTLNNLAILLTDQGRLPEAEALHRESLAQRRQLYPEGHPDLVRSLENLAQVRERRGDRQEAAELRAEAGEIEKN